MNNIEFDALELGNAVKLKSTARARNYFLGMPDSTKRLISKYPVWIVTSKRWGQLQVKPQIKTKGKISLKFGIIEHWEKTTTDHFNDELFEV